MPLINHNHPPGGFPYFEAALNWRAPDPMLPFEMIVEQIQRVRLNNLHAGLDPSREACAFALDLFTCTRLKNNPAWCYSPESRIAKLAAQAKKASGCAGCRKRRAASHA